MPLDDDGQGVPYATYGFAAQIAEVEVDSSSARCRLLHDPRRARRRPRDQPDPGRGPDPRRHRAGHRHGADGGVRQRPHRQPARLSDPDRRRRAADRGAPRSRIPEPLGPYGAKGVGEPALIATAPAILNAIHARDRRAHAPSVPVTPTACARRCWRRADERRPCASEPSSTPLRRRSRSSSSTRARPSGWPPTRCAANACPVLCQISPGKLGACDRYGNVDGVLTRVDPVLLLRRSPAPSVVEWQVPRRTAAGTARWSRDAPGVRLRRRLGHDLSRLQAGAVHRLVAARRASTWSRSSPRASSATAASR